MKKIGVITSGGDAPGMNACVRAVVRTAIANKLEVVGVCHGYKGMIEGDKEELGLRSVSGIIHTGGTILRTARCPEFHEPEGRAKAAENLRKWGIEGLVVCGGDGTFHGAELLEAEHGIPSVGTPGTIDNDLYGTDYTIGYDTAVNVAMDAIDRIRDTAASHDRLFFIEVMGRHCGYLALEAGIAGGAEGIFIPEIEHEMETVIESLRRGRRTGKTSFVVVVSEGDESGGAFQVAGKVRDALGMKSKVTILGHIQRGGKPTVRDRVLASRLGCDAVLGLLDGRSNVMAGEVGGEVVFTPYRETWEKQKVFAKRMMGLADTLAL